MLLLRCSRDTGDLVISAEVYGSRSRHDLAISESYKMNDPSFVNRPSFSIPVQLLTFTGCEGFCLVLLFIVCLSHISNPSHAFVLDYIGRRATIPRINLHHPGLLPLWLHRPYLWSAGSLPAFQSSAEEYFHPFDKSSILLVKPLANCTRDLFGHSSLPDAAHSIQHWLRRSPCTSARPSCGHIAGPCHPPDAI